MQDAVATANRLGGEARARDVASADLRAIQRRREWPVRITQRMQVLVQNRSRCRRSHIRGEISVPLAVRLLQRYPVLRRLPARLIGMGCGPSTSARRRALDACAYAPKMMGMLARSATW